ncbi:MAG: hypothetical protein WC516_06235 [Patescibacteria group bacterium]|jgi:hypothetical protein
MIDYQKISNSVNFYEQYGFIPIEVPWVVNKKFINITLPYKCLPTMLSDNNCLVGSAEQSFLKLLYNKLLKKGYYQAITPCFRDDEEDYLHKKWFIKNELIATKDVNNKNLHKIIKIAYDFFNQYIPNLVVIQTESPKIAKCNFDIMYNNIELGSYGIRNYQGLKWIYATGCAEPRLSIAIQHYLKKEKLYDS